MSTVSFSNPVLLPYFENGVQVGEILAGGCIEHGFQYDGFRNKIEITPLRYDPRFIGAFESQVAGQSYTIGTTHLQRLQIAANYAATIQCEHCGRRRGFKATVCCNVPVDGGINSLADLNDVLCKHKETLTNAAGSPVCVECGVNW